MLTIGEIFLELNVLEVDGAVRSLEALAELRDMEHVVHICKVERKLELIGEIASLADDLERTQVSRGKLHFDTKATSTFHWRDADVNMISDPEGQITVLTIIVALLAGLGCFEVITNDLHISSTSVIMSLPRSWRSPVSDQLRGVRHFLP